MQLKQIVVTLKTYWLEVFDGEDSGRSCISFAKRMRLPYPRDEFCDMLHHFAHRQTSMLRNGGYALSAVFEYQGLWPEKSKIHWRLSKNRRRRTSKAFCGFILPSNNPYSLLFPTPNRYSKRFIIMMPLSRVWVEYCLSLIILESDFCVFTQFSLAEQKSTQQVHIFTKSTHLVVYLENFSTIFTDENCVNTQKLSPWF